MPKKEQTNIKEDSKDIKGVKKTVVKNSLYNFLLRGTNRIGSFIFTIIIARVLLEKLFGLYSLVLAIIMIFMSSLDAGFNTTTVRYVSEALGKKDEAKARTYFKYLLNMKLLFIGVIAILLLIFAKPIAIYIFNKPLLTSPLQVGAIYLLVSSLLMSFMSIFYALQRVKYNTIQETIFQVLRLALIFVFIILLKYEVIGVYFAMIIAAILALVFLLFILIKNYNFLLFGKKIWLNKRKLFKYFGFITISSISAYFFIYVSNVILGVILTEEFVGYYQIAMTIVITITTLMIMADIMLPVFTQQKGKNFQHFFNKSFYYLSLIAFPCAFGIPFIAKPIIVLIFGSSYALSTIPLYVLSFFIIEGATGIFFTTAFQAKEKPQYPAILTAITLLLNIILSYFLIVNLAKISPEYGMLGAAIAVVISRYFYFFNLASLARKKLDLYIGFKQILKPLIASIIMMIFLIVFNNFIGLSWPLVLIEIVIALIIYTVFLFIFKAISKKDLKMIKLLR